MLLKLTLAIITTLETATKTGFVMVFGEISCSIRVDYTKVIRKTVTDIGYDTSEKCFDGKTCGVLVAIEEQSEDIAGGVHRTKTLENIGAGDQVWWFKYGGSKSLITCIPCRA